MSTRIDTETVPGCPICKNKKLNRQISSFSISKGLSENSPDNTPKFDESKIEQIINELSNEANSINEDNPQEVGQLMRKLYDSTGLKFGPGMEEAISRMESGEDPENIENELGEILENENPFLTDPKAAIKTCYKKALPPKTDETLYKL